MSIKFPVVLNETIEVELDLDELAELVTQLSPSDYELFLELIVQKLARKLDVEKQAVRDEVQADPK